GVARIIAWMTRRSRARRERRELHEAEAPAEAVPTPEELVARVEMHQRVAGIVFDLPEPLRGTLLLRYVEDMSAADIARAQGIPAATVRSRVKDAVDHLRAVFDAGHGRERPDTRFPGPFFADVLGAVNAARAATDLTLVPLCALSEQQRKRALRYVSGRRAMKLLLERTPEIDGVFVASDLMCRGAMHALRELGRRIPDDVAVVGFDDV